MLGLAFVEGAAHAVGADGGLRNLGSGWGGGVLSGMGGGGCLVLVVWVWEDSGGVGNVGDARACVRRAAAGDRGAHRQHPTPTTAPDI